jgi:predicted SAM-dependent methyltransferase
VIHQNIKDVYYLLLFPSSKVLRPFYRQHFRLFGAKRDRAHIGCGKNYLPGFVNLEANFQRKCDYLLDVRAGLPFPDESLVFLYSCHMLEHLHITESIALLKECYRVLKRDGYMRLTLPDFRFVLQILAGEESCDFPRSFKSLEGQAINHLFCDGQHKYGYSREVLEEIALPLGFSKVESANGNDENIPNLTEIEPGGSFSVNLFK